MPLALLCLVALAPASPGDVPDFNREVRPILAEHCFHCHGPDSATRAAGLRLDRADAAHKPRKAGAAFDAVDGSKSEAIRRIHSDDAGEVMPPPDANRPLSDAKKATLKRWADAGSPYAPHWSLAPLPPSVTVPAGSGGWACSPVDEFVHAKLRQQNLRPAAEATRAEWLRRAALDLTGLPPTPEEYAAFEADASPKAFETAADRLLSSSRYGERMASNWLDLARYGDSEGYQIDRWRAVWPYRDWVIQSFNANTPYDRFLTAQLAGDLLPNATQSDKLATAFNRLHMQTSEGGVVPEEYRVTYVADRVATFGTAALGLTLDCCRCHDHKYDPVSQKEYYGLFALFQNIDESGQTSYFTAGTPTPALPLATDADAADEARLRRLVREAEARHRWALALAGPAGGGPAKPAVQTFDTDAGMKSLKAIESPRLVPGNGSGRAVELTGDDGYSFADFPAADRATPFTLGLWLKPAKLAPRGVVLHQSKASGDAASRGSELLLESGRVTFGLNHFWPGNAVCVRTKAAIPAGEWTHVAATSDGSGAAAGLTIFVNGAPVEVEVVRDGLTRDIRYGGAEPPLTLGQRFRDAGFQGLADEVYAGPMLTRAEVALLAGQNLAPDSPLVAEHRRRRAESVTAAATALKAARQALAAKLEGVPEIMVMAELPSPRPARVLVRGAYDAPGDPVAPGTPAALPPWPQGEPRNRLGLARWLFDPAHPLTSRVQANRLWAQLFGRGLVESVDNFGLTGAAPTHPELLDWLARHYVEGAYDTKALLKELVLSATYRQSSRASDDAAARDPANEWLARMPTRRLSAEMLRDQALMLSGLLREKLGGPSAHPYQPAGVWDDAMEKPAYPAPTPEGVYRRGVYTVAKRTAPHPQQSVFDAPDRSACSAKRAATATPLQALALLNDPQHVEAALHLGAKARAARADTAGRLAWLTRAATGRAPTGREAAVLAKLYAGQLAHFEARPEEAKKLLGTGVTRLPPSGASDAERCALGIAALAVLNHSEVTTRR